tara:strand:- start:696 stop:1388 length:693 start_codon:yes stop_codon:yes gene_type:complete
VLDNLAGRIESELLSFVYGPNEILINMALAFFIGLILSAIYKTTHKGLSYSQSFMLTIVFVTFIVSIVIMVIGNNLARAFALVGALSIIRFRTVIKDTKDTAYIFMGLAGGMAAGTSSYFLAVSGTILFLCVAYALFLTNYGAFYKSEFILSFRVITGLDEPKYSYILKEFSRVSNLLHIETSADNSTAKLTYDIVLKKNKSPSDFTKDIGSVDGVSEVVLVASKTDTDY